jgi:hypothetical protein
MSDDLAKEIAKGALRIEWKDTESAARRVAEHAADRIAELEADLRKMALDYLAAEGQAAEAYQAQLAAEAKLAKAVAALKRSAEGWSNALELNIIASQHRTSAGILRDEARSVLAELKGETDA